MGSRCFLKATQTHLQFSAPPWSNIRLTLWKELITERTSSGVSHPNAETTSSSLSPDLRPSKSTFFRSGNIETNGDRFYNTTVEVLPVHLSVKEKVSRGEMACCKPSSDGFVQIGSFKNGVAEGEVDAALGISEAMRILVHSDSDVWVLLSEIFIKV